MHLSFKITYFSFILCIYLLFYNYMFIFYIFLHFSFFYPKSPLNIYHCFQFSIFMYFLNVRMSGFYLLCLLLCSIFSSLLILFKSSVLRFVSSYFILFFILKLSKRNFFAFLFFLIFFKTIFFSYFTYLF